MVDKSKAYAEYEAVRILGQTNMYDKNMVQQIAYMNNFHNLVALIREEEYENILKNYSDNMEILKIHHIEIPEAKEVTYGLVQ